MISCPVSTTGDPLIIRRKLTLSPINWLVKDFIPNIYLLLVSLTVFFHVCFNFRKGTESGAWASGKEANSQRAAFVFGWIWKKTNKHLGFHVPLITFHIMCLIWMRCLWSSFRSSLLHQGSSWGTEPVKLESFGKKHCQADSSSFISEVPAPFLCQQIRKTNCLWEVLSV